MFTSERILFWLKGGGGVPLMILGVALIDVRRVTDIAYAAGGGWTWDTLMKLDSMVFAEWGAILSATAALEWNRFKYHPVERWIGAAAVMCGLVFIGIHSHWYAILCGCLIGVRLVVEPTMRFLSAALLVVSLQYFMTWGQFKQLLAISAQIDAWSVDKLLRLFGSSTNAADTVVGLAGSNFAIDIGTACSSLFCAELVVSGYLVFTLCTRTRWQIIAKGVVIALAATYVVNMFRLSRMAVSRENYEFWHNDDGASIIGFVLVLIAFGLAEIAKAKNAAAMDTSPTPALGAT